VDVELDEDDDGKDEMVRLLTALYSDPKADADGFFTAAEAPNCRINVRVSAMMEWAGLSS